jgi:hypothetical protein
VEFWPHIFPGERAYFQSDEIDIHFSSDAPDDRYLMWKIENWPIFHHSETFGQFSKFLEIKSRYVF